MSKVNSIGDIVMFSKVVKMLSAIVLTVGVLCGCGKKNDGVTKLKLAHGLDVKHPVHLAMVKMAEIVKEKSDGTLTIDIYPGGQMGGERSCIEQVQMGGKLNMTKCSAVTLENFVPIMRVFGMPYLFRDSEHFWNVLDGKIGQELLQAGEKKKIHGLCYYDAGARSFYTTKRKIESPADLRGMKIRTMKTNICINTISQLGGSAVSTAWGELYSSLSQGLVDGAENNTPSFLSSNHYGLCKYYILDEHARIPDILIMNSKTWKKLSPEHQKILKEAIAESVKYERELWKKAEVDDLKIVQEKNPKLKIIHPDLAPFKKAVQPMYEKVKGTDLGKLVDRIKDVK